MVPTGTTPRVSSPSSWPVLIATILCGAAGMVVVPPKWATVRGNWPSGCPEPMPSGTVRGAANDDAAAAWSSVAALVAAGVEPTVDGAPDTADVEPTEVPAEPDGAGADEHPASRAAIRPTVATVYR